LVVFLRVLRDFVVKCFGVVVSFLLACARDVTRPADAR
jgi:hypothetical protein